MMKLNLSSYHVLFMLFLIQAGYDATEKSFGMIKIKLDSIDSQFTDRFNIYDRIYYLSFGIANLFFWRLPFLYGFRKIAIASLTLRCACYFICPLLPGDPWIYTYFLWSSQAFLQGIINAAVQSLIIFQFVVPAAAAAASRGEASLLEASSSSSSVDHHHQHHHSASGRFVDYRYSLYIFFIGFISTLFSFITTPNVADESLCSTLVTLGLLTINVLNYIVCFFPSEQIQLAMSALSLASGGDAASGGGGGGDCKPMTAGSSVRLSPREVMRDLSSMLRNRALLCIVACFVACMAMRHYIYLNIPMELYFRVFFPAPNFQIIFLHLALIVEAIGILGCVVLLACRDYVGICRGLSIDRPMLIAFVALIIGIPLLTPAVEDVTRIEDGLHQAKFMPLLLIGIAFVYFAKVLLTGPALLRLGHAIGSAPAAIAFVYGLSSLIFVIFLTIQTSITDSNPIIAALPFVICGTIIALFSTIIELCRPATRFGGFGAGASSSSTLYRPLLGGMEGIGSAATD